MTSRYLLWLDLETTGLDPREDQTRQGVGGVARGGGEMSTVSQMIRKYVILPTLVFGWLLAIACALGGCAGLVYAVVK